MTQMWYGGSSSGRYEGGLSELSKSFMSRMTEATMPEGSRSTISHGDEGSGRRCWKMERVQRAGAIGPDDFPPRPKILHRTTKRVKFDRTIIINGKLANG